MQSFLPLLAVSGLTIAQSFPDRCRGFTIDIPNVKVCVLEFVPNGTNLTFPNNVRMLSRIIRTNIQRTQHVPVQHSSFMVVISVVWL